MYTLQKGICYFDIYIVHQSCNMVLWEDTRIVPRDSQLWAIQCAWSSYRNNQICYKGLEDCFDIR